MIEYCVTKCCMKKNSMWQPKIIPSNISIHRKLIRLIDDKPNWMWLRSTCFKLTVLSLNDFSIVKKLIKLARWSDRRRMLLRLAFNWSNAVNVITCATVLASGVCSKLVPCLRINFERNVWYSTRIFSCCWSILSSRSFSRLCSLSLISFKRLAFAISRSLRRFALAIDALVLLSMRLIVASQTKSVHFLFSMNVY